MSITNFKETLEYYQDLNWLDSRCYAVTLTYPTWVSTKQVQIDMDEYHIRLYKIYSCSHSVHFTIEPTKQGIPHIHALVFLTTQSPLISNWPYRAQVRRTFKSKTNKKCYENWLKYIVKLGPTIYQLGTIQYVNLVGLEHTYFETINTLEPQESTSSTSTMEDLQLFLEVHNPKFLELVII